MNSVPFGREECFFRALIIKRRASGTGAANRCAKKLQGLRDARTMRERLHDLRRLGGRTAHTVRKPVAHARWDRVGFVGKARAIRVGNRGTPRGKRAGTALDSHQIREEFPLDPRQQNVRWRRYNGRAGPRKQNNEPEEPLEGELLAGKLPPRQAKLVVAWAALHKSELDDNWYLASSNGTCFRIDPLI